MPSRRPSAPSRQDATPRRCPRRAAFPCPARSCASSTAAPPVPPAQFPPGLAPLRSHGSPRHSPARPRASPRSHASRPHSPGPASHPSRVPYVTPALLPPGLTPVRSPARHTSPTHRVARSSTAAPCVTPARPTPHPSRPHRLPVMPPSPLRQQHSLCPAPHLSLGPARPTRPTPCRDARPPHRPRPSHQPGPASVVLSTCTGSARQFSRPRTCGRGHAGDGPRRCRAARPALVRLPPSGVWASADHAYPRRSSTSVSRESEQSFYDRETMRTCCR